MDEATWPGGHSLLQRAGGSDFNVPSPRHGYSRGQVQLEGQKLKGVLLLHLVLACVSSVMIWLVWWLHFRARRRTEALPNYRLGLEFLGVGIIALTGHLGGFLSGVNGPS